MQEEARPRAYLLVHQGWYEIPEELDPLRRNAKVTTLNPGAFAPSGDTQLVKHCYQVLQVPDELPFAFTICECRRVGEPHYDTFEEAQDFLRAHGVSDPRVGFNPVG